MAYIFTYMIYVHTACSATCYFEVINLLAIRAYKPITYNKYICTSIQENSFNTFTSTSITIVQMVNILFN